jgi:UDP-glucose 4-epimerase
MDRKVKSQPINLGTGHGYSVRQVIDAARRITGRAFVANEAERREGDPPALVASADRAREQLGWTAQHSSIEEIIASAWAWHQRRFPA